MKWMIVLLRNIAATLTPDHERKQTNRANTKGNNQNKPHNIGHRTLPSGRI